MDQTESKPLKIGLACGGTGGHIFPGLATAEVLREKGHDVTLWMAGKDIESESTRHWSGPVHTIQAQGFQGGLKRAPQTLLQLLNAYRQCLALMRNDKPDVLLAMGSYASFGPVRAAAKLGVPVVLHEANLIPGRAISYLSKFAKRVGVSFEETRHYLRNADLKVTGMPLRGDIAKAAEVFERTPRPDRPFTILSMGGSRGARALNVMVRRAVRELHLREDDLAVIHLTGKADEEEVRQSYENTGVPHEVAAFSHDMVGLYKRTDLAICRAGAASCAELSAFGVPSLLVPYPFAAKDHQTANAEALQRLNAVDVVPESNLETDWLVDYLQGCMHTPERLQRLSDNMLSRSRTDAAERLAELVEEVAGS